METKDKILIVEDDETIAAFLIAVLEANGFDTIRASLGREAVTLISSHCPDLVLLDLSLPDMDGMEILAGLRKWSTLPVIVVSARGRERDKVIALDMGADDYLTKPFNILELKARIKALLRRSKSGRRQEEKPDSRLVCEHITLDRDARDAFNDGKLVDLTAKEFDLMELLMRNPNRVYSREALLNAIWGYDTSSDIRTVDVHIRRLREKLERSPAAPEHIMTKWGVGYYFKF